MPRNKKYKPWLVPDIRADHLGYPYPPLPDGGARQVLGTMSTDDNITPVIPEWLPKRLWTRWSEIWHGRDKQYKSPGSKELIPWDTTHNVLGDYNGYEEYYVEGCFGYDEQGTEIMYRPALPQVHCWHGQGLYIVNPVWPQPEVLPPDFTMFNFYTSPSPLQKDKMDDINLMKLDLSPVSSPDNKYSKNKDGKLFEDTFIKALAIDIFQDFSSIDDLARQSKVTYPSKSPLSILPAENSLSIIDANTLDEDTLLAKHDKTIQGLMSLPGEIRNIIYTYLFDESKEYEIVWCTPKKDLTHYIHKTPLAIKGFKTGWRHLSRDNDSLDPFFERPVLNRAGATARRRYAREVYGRNNHEDRVEDLQAAGPAAFLLTCRQAYKETVCMFYGRQTFSFCSRGLLRHFMNKLSQPALASIKHIYIAHDPVAWPLRSTDAELVHKEYGYWIQDLKNMVAACADLEELHMLVQIRDPHVNNTDCSEWAMALRRGLAGLKYLDKFQSFDLTIRLADDSSNIAWAARHGTRLQKERARDLQDLVQLVKSRIFESVQDDKDA